MKLEPGKCVYPFPPIGEIVSIALDTGIERDQQAALYVVALVSPADWAIMRGDPGKPALRGQVMYAAYLGPDGLAVYPAPHTDCDLLVSYYPPMMTA